MGGFEKAFPNLKGLSVIWFGSYSSNIGHHWRLVGRLCVSSAHVSCSTGFIVVIATIDHSLKIPQSSKQGLSNHSPQFQISQGNVPFCQLLHLMDQEGFCPEIEKQSSFNLFTLSKKVFERLNLNCNRVQLEARVKRSTYAAPKCKSDMLHQSNFNCMCVVHEGHSTWF